MSTPHTKVHTDMVNHLSQQMDALCQRAIHLLTQYDDATNHVSAAAFRGQAGHANLVTSAQIREAAMHIQNRFDQVNQVLHGGAVHFANTEADNAAKIQSVLRLT